MEGLRNKKIREIIAVTRSIIKDITIKQLNWYADKYKRCIDQANLHQQLHRTRICGKSKVRNTKYTKIFEKITGPIANPKQLSAEIGKRWMTL